MITQFTLTEAQKVIQAALDEADRQGLTIAAVVTDKRGDIVACARMDAATYVGVETSRLKAATAANFGIATHSMLQFLSSDPLFTNPLAAASITNLPNMALIPGGFPIKADGVVVGGLGISGGRGEQDQQIAEAGLAVLNVAA